MAEEKLQDIDTIYVPGDFAENSCGFSLDIGGSVAKLVYRCNEDYKDGKPLKDFGKFDDGRVKGQLRLVLVPRNHLDLVISYVKERCDMTKRDGEVTVYTTGIGGNFFRKRLQEELGIKTTNVFESDCFVKAFSLLRGILPHEEFIRPLSPDLLEKHKDLIDQLKKLNQEWQVDTGAKPKAEPPAAAAADGADGEKKADAEETSLLIMCGSGFGMMTTDAVRGESKHQFVEGIWKGGRSFLGLARMLTGLDRYEDIMALVEKSDGQSVDIVAGDLKVDGVTDAYSLMPDDLPIFPFGKAVDVPKEKLDKGDLVHSLLNWICSDTCVVIYLTCMRLNLRKVYFVGNFVNHPKTQELLAKALTVKNSLMPHGSEPIDFQFVRNGGHFGALGAYLTDSIALNLKK